MARPSSATVTSTTPGGIVFQWLLDGLQSKGAADANQEVVNVLVKWEEREGFLREAVGYVGAWNGTDTFLDRTVPLRCPTRGGLWLTSFDHVKSGAYETRTTFASGAGNIPVQDWSQYALTFTRPAWNVYTNAELAATYGNREKNRYVSIQRQFLPRERRVSGLGFEYDTTDAGAWASVPDEAVSIPDHSIRYVVTLHEWPEYAIPWTAIADRLVTVNSAAFRFEDGGILFPAESLLFRGPHESIRRYQSAAGDWVADIPYVVDFRPGKYGWNGYLRPEVDGTPGAPYSGRLYGRVRRRHPTDAAKRTPPYAGSDFSKLFEPGT